MTRKLRRNPKRRYTAIDLFSGCGGLTLGLKRAGFDVRAAVEIDSVAANAYATNHPRTTLLVQDIRKVTGRQLKRAARLGGKRLDLLAGCPPCQGFSRIRFRNRDGGDDSQNDLVIEFLRLARELRPKMILLENVPGLGKDRRFRRMTSSLKRRGYACNWGILDAADFGVPQRRKRLILMASRVGRVSLPADNGVRATVRNYIESLDKNLDKPERTKDALHAMYLKSSPRIKKLIAKIPKNGGGRLALPRRDQLPCHKKVDGFKDVYGRMRWDDVAPTLTGGCFNPSKGRFLHPMHNRALTLREAALLQTFPRSYHFPARAGLTTVARLIGDALPPLFAEKQGRHLMRRFRSFPDG